MPVIDNLQSESQGLLDIAKLMMVSARTAPKSGGKDDIETMVIYGEDKDQMKEIQRDFYAMEKMSRIQKL